MIFPPSSRPPHTRRGAWGFVAVIGILAIVGAIAVAIEMRRAPANEPGVALAWGRYGPTHSIAERGETDGAWVLYCRRTATECLPRAARLCGGPFEATALPQPESGWHAVAHRRSFGAPNDQAQPVPTITEWSENLDLRMRRTGLIGFRNGNRITCLSQS
ncbi:hypothetical protein V8J82_15540 [Gymnodinialimonas sp. 2305UL16-5]|uniref:hypothetical protein n=1 Tax=Gymnodinialimonas mytili TaxID=3126503 RepID=UPI0030B28309